MVPVPWCDILEITVADKASFSLTGHSLGNIPPEKNLVLKALRNLESDTGISLPPLAVHLHKVIPDGAGLGGGSADASFALRAVNDLLSLELSNSRLVEIAAKTGADCPFFIYNRPMLSTGIGREFTPSEVSLSGLTIFIARTRHRTDSHARRTAVAQRPLDYNSETHSRSRVNTGRLFRCHSARVAPRNMPERIRETSHRSLAHRGHTHQRLRDLGIRTPAHNRRHSCPSPLIRSDIQRHERIGSITLRHIQFKEGRRRGCRCISRGCHIHIGVKSLICCYGDFYVILHDKKTNKMNELPQKYNPAEVEDKWYA